MNNTQNQEDPIIYSFDQEISLSVPHPVRERLQKLLNIAWLGRENCNKFVDGKYVNDVEDPVLDKKLTEAHYNMNCSNRVKITVHVHKSGRKSYERA